MEYNEIDAAADRATLRAYSIEGVIQQACSKKLNASKIVQQTHFLSECVDAFLSETAEFVAAENAPSLLEASARLRRHVDAISACVAGVMRRKTNTDVLLHFWEETMGFSAQLLDREREVCQCLFHQ